MGIAPPEVLDSSWNGMSKELDIDPGHLEFHQNGVKMALKWPSK